MKKIEDILERMQEESGDICVFLGLNKCSGEDLEPYKCIQGDYMLCDRYTKVYQEYVNGKKD